MEVIFKYRFTCQTRSNIFAYRALAVQLSSALSMKCTYRIRTCFSTFHNSTKDKKQVYNCRL